MTLSGLSVTVAFIARQVCLRSVMMSLTSEKKL